MAAILSLAGAALSLILVREREIERDAFQPEVVPEPAPA